MLTKFIEWLVILIGSAGYWGVGFAMFLESFFAPIPSEIILPFSGFVASRGELNIWVVIIVATVAAYVGSLPFYLVGRWGEKSVMNFLGKYGKYLFISKKDLDKGFQAFEEYGNGIVLVGRLIPIVRTVISFPAGVSKMKFWIFTLFTFIGTGIWSTILAMAGYLLGSQWEVVSEYVGKYEKIIIIVLLIAVVLYVVRGIKNILNEKREEKRNVK